MTVFEDWHEIDSIFLDMDGTLLDLYFDNHFWLEYVPRTFARVNSISEQDAFDQLMARYTAARGTLDWYCIDYWTDQLELDIRGLKREIADKIAIRPNVKLFLEAIQALDKRVVMVTNAHPATVEIKLEMTSIDVHFDRIIDSHDIGLAKEQSGFWDALNRKEPFSRERTMLIDDNLEVLQSAADYGIAHLYGIAEPDSVRGRIDSKPFEAIEDFSDFISTLQ